MTFRTRRATRRSVALIVVALVVSLLGAITVGATSTPDRYHGSLRASESTHPIVGIAAARSDKGYWLVASDGGVFTFGAAKFFGSTGGRALAAPIVGIAATPSGNGYWLVASDGGVFTFGDARFYGSTGGRALAAPIVGIAATPSGNGYWLVASDGGVVTFGDATFYGSTTGWSLGAPIVGIAATPSGRGYWLAGVDGGVFTFGDARFYGSALGGAASSAILGIAATRSGDGYWLAAVSGTTHAFGHARAFRTQFPSAPGSGFPLGDHPVDAIAASPDGGYLVASSVGAVGVSAIQAPPRRITAPVAPRPSPAPQQRAAARVTTPRLSSLIALQLLIRMNVERAARHLAPLSWDELLASRAQLWAQSLLATGGFYHQNLDTIVSAANGLFEEVGENIFSGSGGAADAGAAHVGFMRSAEHRSNMLLPQGQLVGIGAACLNGTLMVVEDFAITMGSPLPPAGQSVPAENPIVAPQTNGASC
jgi:uncharacterized protein YkwD